MLKKLGLIDCDNVCLCWLGWLINQVDIEPTPKGLRSGCIFDMWPNKPQKELEALVKNPRGYRDAKPVVGAAKTLHWLLVSDPSIEIIYVSAAPVNGIYGRKIALDNYNFPMPGDYNYRVHDVLHVGGREKKDQWILEHKEDLFFIVDDSLPTMDISLLAGIKYRYLFCRPWNLPSNEHHFVLDWLHLRHRMEKELITAVIE